MVFLDRTYSVLLVSAAEKFNESLMPLLPGSMYYPVTTVKSVSAAKRRLLEQHYDLVLVNDPLPDDPGVRLAMDACADSPAGVLLFVRRELYDEICDQVSEWGVAVLPKPTNTQAVTWTLQILRATRERMRRMEEKQVTVEEKIREMRLVNQAKWQLISRNQMTEAEAHRYIEKLSMDTRRSKGEVAAEILKTPGSGAE